MASNNFKWVPGSEMRKAPHPILHDDIYALYKASRDAFWKEDEVVMTGDRFCYESKLTTVEQNLVKYILSYFARIDVAIGPIIDNISQDVNCYEAQIAYTENKNRETVHALSYMLQIKAIARNDAELNEMINASDDNPIIKAMTDWATKWFTESSLTNTIIDNPIPPIAIKLVAMAAIEGVMFCSSFAWIQWLRDRKLLDGITMSNSLISRDESLHTMLSCLLVKKYLINKPQQSVVNAIFGELIEILDNFVDNALSEPIGIMSTKEMKKYVRFQTDCIITDMGYEPIYYLENPFPFMNKLSVNSIGKANFFEETSHAYSTRNASTTIEMDDNLSECI